MGAKFELVQTREMVINTVIWGVPITLVLALFGGFMISRSTTRRLETINATSRQIAEGALDERIPTRGTDDEFDRLAIQLNKMLGRNQSLMEGLRHITDNIAHDLRTPLTRLRGSLEELNQNGLPAEDRLIGVEEPLEADTLLSIFNALLGSTD